MRLFIAINFDDETRSQLLALCDELRGKSERGRYSVKRELKFKNPYLNPLLLLRNGMRIWQVFTIDHPL